MVLLWLFCADIKYFSWKRKIIRLQSEMNLTTKGYKSTRRKDVCALCGYRLLAKNEWQTVLRIADHHDLRVRALGQSFCGFDPFPFQKLRTDPLRDNLL